MDEHYMDFFIRSYGVIPDKRIDASVIGLVYPFDIYDPMDDRIIASIHEVEDKLSINDGIHRYEHAEYDGWMLDGEHRKKGAGACLLLNFWLSVYYCFKRTKFRIGKSNKYTHEKSKSFMSTSYCIPEFVDLHQL